MALPSLISTRPRRSRQNVSSSPGTKPTPASHEPAAPSKSTIKSATRTRQLFALLSSFLYLIALVFVVVVEVGNVHADSRRVTGSIFFLKLDLSHIIPRAIPQAQLINSIARTLGLHDFYQVGLWNYCGGYNGQGITTCSRPKTLYWFNPVQIILDELLAGATIALPENIISALELVRLASHWMFALFLTAAPLITLSIFLTPLSTITRWATFPVSILTFLAALFTTAASVIGTVMFVIFKNIIHNAEDSINIIPSIGSEMFAFMWIASGASIIGWLIMMGECCCCASRRDVRQGRKRGRKSAWSTRGETALGEMRTREEGAGRISPRTKKQ